MTTVKTIRDAVHGEVIRCAEMMTATDPWRFFSYTVEECLAGLSAPDAAVKVALSSGEVIGFVAVRAKGVGSSPLVTALCVRDGDQGLGVGTSLIEAVEREVFDGGSNLFLFVSSFNLGAIRLYTRLGYEKVGELTNYNVPGHSEYLLRKTTGPRRRTPKG